MTAKQENARQSLVEIVGYFKMVAEDCNWHSWRKSEYDVVSQIAALISAKDNYTKADFEAIALCINGIVGQAHANGSGWMDFQSRIHGFFSAFGYETAWDEGTGAFLFW